LNNSDNCGTALSESETLIKMIPQDAGAHNLKGNAEYCLGDIPAALVAFGDASKIDPNYRPAQYNKAAALIRLGEYAKAADVLRPLVAADPNYISARYNLAVAQAALKNYSEAFKNFELVYERDKSFDSSFGLGFLFVLNDAAFSEEKSAEHFRIAISLRPALVCILHGKIPVDPALQEETPFIDIVHLAEGNPTFRQIRANFDSKFKDAVCQNV